MTAHAVAAFGQPVFAGVYLTGAIGGLSWHARGADVVFSLAIAQLAAAAAVWPRTGTRWPLWVSLAVLAGESVQYAAGLRGLLWLHLPLGVAIIAALTVLVTAVWRRPLPDRERGGRGADRLPVPDSRAAGVNARVRDGSDV